MGFDARTITPTRDYARQSSSTPVGARKNKLKMGMNNVHPYPSPLLFTYNKNPKKHPKSPKNAWKMNRNEEQLRSITYLRFAA